MSHPRSILLTPLDFHAAMQDGGYRIRTFPADRIGMIRPDTRDELSFMVRFGDGGANRCAERGDVSVLATVRLQGDQPFAVVNRWAVTKRFAGSPHGASDLAVDASIAVIGGMTAGHLGTLLDCGADLVDKLLADFKAKLTRERSQDPKRSGRAASALVAAGGVTLIGGFSAASAQRQIEMCDRIARQVIPDLWTTLAALAALDRAYRRTLPTVSRRAARCRSARSTRSALRVAQAALANGTQ